MNKKDSFITLPKWHRLLLKGMAVGIVCFFSFAVLLYLLYNPGEDFDKALYIKSFIITPTLMQVAVVFIFGFTVKFLENRLSNLSMTIILLICFNMYLGIMVGVHNSVPEMAILLIYPIFGATIYNSRTVVIFQGILSTAVYIFIKSVIVPQSTFFIPINTNRTYYIIFIGLTIGAMTISLLLKRVSTAIVNNSIQEKKILELAVKTDQMTGLLNHRTFYETLTDKINKSNLESKFSVLVLDIDNFKSVNDRYGHSAGDKIILKAVKIINDNIRSSDAAFRYGGEEFAVILENTDEAAAYRIGERIVNSFYTMNNNSEFGDDKFSLSAGVVEFLLEEYTASELFEAADSALYYAKNHGKNRCIRFSDIKNLSE